MGEGEGNYAWREEGGPRFGQIRRALTVAAVAVACGVGNSASRWELVALVATSAYTGVTVEASALGMCGQELGVETADRWGWRWSTEAGTCIAQ